MHVQSQLNPWLRLMATYAFIDDSGSDPTAPVYVLGGLVLPEESWRLVIADWQHVLDSEPCIEYFKGSEVWDRQKGPFKDLTTEERSRKVEALVDVIETYKPLMLSTRLDWDIFRRFKDSVRLEPEFEDPYFFLFFSLIAQMLSLGVREPKFSRVNFVFDDQGLIGTYSLLWYEFLLHRIDPKLRAVLGDRWPDFGDEKKVLPLQAADLAAWYQRRSALGTLGHETHIRAWERISAISHSNNLFEESLHNIARDMRVLQVPAV
jgi:hypothetical protein